MANSKSTPGIPVPWQNYIKAHAGKYATGMFSREDAIQVAMLAFLRARARFKPGKGALEHYTKVAIRNALINANRAEQKHWDQRDLGDDDPTMTDATPLWAGEEFLLEALDESTRDERISIWADALPLTLAPVWDGLYARDMTQREFAVEMGVSQPRVSQRNGQFLARARLELETLLTP